MAEGVTGAGGGNRQQQLYVGVLQPELHGINVNRQHLPPQGPVRHEQT